MTPPATTVPLTGSAGGRVQVLVHRIDPELPMPLYALPGDAGADIVAAADIVLAPGERAVLPTGIAIALPQGYAAFVHPRSGLAARAGLGLVNAPGTIDAGYRGEIKVIVINHDSAQPIVLSRGERIAQLVIQRVEYAEFVEVAELPPSERGAGGHGSTGGAAVLARDVTATETEATETEATETEATASTETAATETAAPAPEAVHAEGGSR